MSQRMPSISTQVFRERVLGWRCRFESFQHKGGKWSHGQGLSPKTNSLPQSVSLLTVAGTTDPSSLLVFMGSMSFCSSWALTPQFQTLLASYLGSWFLSYAFLVQCPRYSVCLHSLFGDHMWSFIWDVPQHSWDLLLVSLLLSAPVLNPFICLSDTTSKMSLCCCKGHCCCPGLSCLSYFVRT